MNHSTRISIDLTKNIFQVCVSTHPYKRIESNRKIKRRDLLAYLQSFVPTSIVMEACYSAHYWGREFQKLGHHVMLIPAQHVKPFVRGNKTDHNDAVAILEASYRPNIRFVPVKTIEQQDVQLLLKSRELKVGQRTSLINQLRGFLSEYGLVIPQTRQALKKAIPLSCRKLINTNCKASR